MAAPLCAAHARRRCEQARLAEYAPAFDDLGYDDLGFLLSMSQAELSSVAEAVRMKPGHAQKFLKLLPATEAARRRFRGPPAWPDSVLPL